MPRLSKDFKALVFLVAVVLAFLAGDTVDYFTRRGQTISLRANLLYSALKRHDTGAIRDYASPNVTCWLEGQDQRYGQVTDFQVVDAHEVSFGYGVAVVKAKRGGTEHTEVLHCFSTYLFGEGGSLDGYNSTNDACVDPTLQAIANPAEAEPFVEGPSAINQSDLDPWIYKVTLVNTEAKTIYVCFREGDAGLRIKHGKSDWGEGSYWADNAKLTLLSLKDFVRLIPGSKASANYELLRSNVRWSGPAQLDAEVLVFSENDIRLLSTNRWKANGEDRFSKPISITVINSP